MSTNGILVAPESELSPTQRADVLREERLAVMRERETLRIRYRVRKAINGEGLRELETALEQCERALGELDTIAREWGV